MTVGELTAWLAKFHPNSEVEVRIETDADNTIHISGPYYLLARTPTMEDWNRRTLPRE